MLIPGFEDVQKDKKLLIPYRTTYFRSLSTTPSPHLLLVSSRTISQVLIIATVNGTFLFPMVYLVLAPRFSPVAIPPIYYYLPLAGSSE